MPTPSLTDELCKQAAAAFQRHGSKSGAARALGLNRVTFIHRLKCAAERGLLGFKPVLPGYAIKQTSTQEDSDGNVERQWIQQHKESGPRFTMPAGQVLKGVSALVDSEQRIRYQWIKSKADTCAPELIEALKKVFAEYAGKARPCAPPRFVARDYLVGYPIADPHFGMLAWPKETGGPAYDLRIARRLLRENLGDLVGQSKPARIGLICNLGDWQHTDDQKNMTPRSGNILDVDGRYPKLLEASVAAQIECIELAKRKHQLVIWDSRRGNHDPRASVAMTLALQLFYRKDNGVRIVTTPDDFFFYRFGATLIGATHGHKVRPADMAMTMAVRRRKDWGATRHHHFWFGHIHHETAKEVGDVRCESFQTIAPKDAHAASSAYNSGRSLVAITYHRRRGEVGRHRVNL